ncbi:MAG: quinone-dependent dihydroorotate dehydrogenase [Sphingobium sp.]|nr:quinone-dependent dihydroorotate dehydrogenase [Sphingobium sp.]
MIYSLLRPIFFHLDAEKAHHATLSALSCIPSGTPKAPDPMLSSTVAGICFPGPVGLAAGFDKDGKIAHKMHHFGFGFAELGTLTPLPQDGNPRPRLFRLAEDQAVINRMGFNNGGQQDAARRLATMPRAGRVIGINIGANKDAADRVADYVTGVHAMGRLGDYLTINISSPNTPGLRALQSKAALDELLSAITQARGDKAIPLFLKVAPDLEPADREDIAASVLDHKIDALIISNTTISRPPLQSSLGGEGGGLSGAPLHDLALERLRQFRALLGDQIPLIGAGGISNAQQAYARIRAGASLIQLYSAMVYEGPYLAARINAGLKKYLKRDGLTNITQAVGIDTRAA